MKKRSLLIWLSKLSLKSEKGLSLAELMIAITIIPTVIFASSNFQLYTNKIMSNTYDRGMRLTEQIIIFQYLERTMINGSSAEVNPITAFTPSCTSGDEWNYQLKVTLPQLNGNPQPDMFYDFKKACGAASPSFKLSWDLDNNGIDPNEVTEIAYFGSIDYPEAEDGIVNEPFIYDPINKKVTVRLGFKSTDSSSEKVTITSVIKLSGGIGSEA